METQTATRQRTRVPSPSDFQQEPTEAKSNGALAVVDTSKAPTQATTTTPATIDKPAAAGVPGFDKTAVSTIATAITAVMKQIGVVGKDGENTFHHYKYAKMEDILQRLTPLMGEHGLFVTQSEIGRSMFEQGAAVAVEYQFTIAHRDGAVWPDRMLQTGLCRCRDSKGGLDDKALNKCHTAARKYFLLALFQIPTGDIDEADEHSTARPRQERARTKAPQERKPVPSPTGRQPPYEISTKGEKFETWVVKYIAAVSKAETVEELRKWDELNGVPLDELNDKNPPLYEKVQSAVEERENELSARAEPEKPEETQGTAASATTFGDGFTAAENKWLAEVKAAFDAATDLGELAEEQRSVMAPSRDAVSKLAWAKAQGLAEDTFKRIQQGE